MKAGRKPYKLTPAQIRVIRSRKIGIKRLAKKYGVATSTIKHHRNPVTSAARAKRAYQRRIRAKN